MNVAPGASFEWVFDLGETGLTPSVQIDDGTGTLVYGPSTTSIIEIDVTGTYVATLTAPDSAGEYVLQASTDGTYAADTIAADQLVVTANAPFDPPTGDTYADADELARILKIRNPTADQTAALNRVLLAATGEIDAEIDLAAGDDLSGWQLALAAQVCLDRAADLWRHTESIPGVTGLLGDDAGTLITPGRYSWERYAQRLAPLKGQWGLA